MNYSWDPITFERWRGWPLPLHEWKLWTRQKIIPEISGPIVVDQCTLSLRIFFSALSSSTSLIWLGISRILVIQWVCPFTSRFFSLHFDQQLLAAHQFLGLASWDTRHRKAFASATADGSMSFVRFFFVISHGLKKKIPITILTQR